MLGATTDVGLLSSLFDEVVESVELDEDVVELVPLVGVEPQRITAATPVIPRLRILIVAVRFAATCLPFVLTSMMWTHPFALLGTTLQQISLRLLSWPVQSLCGSSERAKRQADHDHRSGTRFGRLNPYSPVVTGSDLRNEGKTKPIVTRHGVVGSTGARSGKPFERALAHVFGEARSVVDDVNVGRSPTHRNIDPHA
jgi:hypothetical protein